MDKRRFNTGQNCENERPPLQKIFSSNLTLKNREAVGNAVNPWTELRSARPNPAKKSFSLIAECLYDFTRTYFIKNS